MECTQRSILSEMHLIEYIQWSEWLSLALESSSYCRFESSGPYVPQILLENRTRQDASQKSPDFIERKKDSFDLGNKEQPLRPKHPVQLLLIRQLDTPFTSVGVCFCVKIVRN